MLIGNWENDSMLEATVHLPPMANGSAGAFELEALPHLNDLYGTALHMLDQPEKAEEAVHRTYLRAWRVFGKHQLGANCKASLFQILINVVRHEGRSRGSWQAPVDLMEVLLLVDGQGFSYGEAAEILGLSTEVVAHRVGLGRNHLQSENI